MGFGVQLICHNLFFALVMCHLVIGGHGSFVVLVKSRVGFVQRTVPTVLRRGVKSAGEFGNKLI